MYVYIEFDNNQHTELLIEMLGPQMTLGTIADMIDDDDRLSWKGDPVKQIRLTPDAPNGWGVDGGSDDESKPPRRPDPDQFQRPVVDAPQA